jgi:transposase-like protein
MPRCPRCDNAHIKKDGRTARGQRYRCHGCHRTFTDRTATPFAGFRWPRAIITLAVHWYCSYRLSAANVAALLAERGIDVSARTVLTWVQTFGPLLAEAARRRARRVGRRWWVDETYVRVKGRWAYLYQAIDEAGQVIDVLLREHRDLASAKAFLAQAITRRGVTPTEVITDGHQAYQRAIREAAPKAIHIVTGLHRAPGHPTTQPMERSHVPGKDRLRPMRGLQSIATGQHLVEGLTVAQAIRQGDVTLGGGGWPPGASLHQRARQVVATFQWLGGELRLAS